MKLYYHKTDGGAEYYCIKAVEGTSEGEMSSAVLRVDGGEIEVITRNTTKHNIKGNFGGKIMNNKNTVELISTQEIKSVIYTLESPHGLYYKVQINYEDGEVNSWLYGADDGEAQYILGFYEDESNAVDMILNEAQDIILNKETGTNYL